MDQELIIQNQETAVVIKQNKFKSLAEEAFEAEENESTGQFINISGGMLMVGGQPIAGNKIRCIILDFIHENVYYPGKFSRTNLEPPTCFAFGRTDKNLIPHDSISAPVFEECDTCPNNEFGTSQHSEKAKACKNTRRLALLPAGDADLTVDKIRSNDVKYFRLPVTSVKVFSAYVKALSVALELPPAGVITEIGLMPDAKNQFKVVFTQIGEIDAVAPEIVDAVLQRNQEQRKLISFPYTPKKQVKAEPTESTNDKF
jgi:hypothetical protein